MLYSCTKFGSGHLQDVSMAHLKVIREKIVTLHKQGLAEQDIASRLLEAKSTVQDVIACYKNTGTAAAKLRKLRSQPIRTQQLVNKVQNQVIQNLHRSTKQMARELDIAETTLWRVLKFYLKLKCFKFTRRQVLSEATVDKRLQQGCIIRDQLVRAPRPTVIWMDEKIFMVQRAWNRQNDRLYTYNLEDIPVNARTIFVRQHPAHVMVWAGNCDDSTPIRVP